MKQKDIDFPDCWEEVKPVGVASLAQDTQQADETAGSGFT
jgi:hypothetical protein